MKPSHISTSKTKHSGARRNHRASTRKHQSSTGGSMEKHGGAHREEIVAALCASAIAFKGCVASSRLG